MSAPVVKALAPPGNLERRPDSTPSGAKTSSPAKDRTSEWSLTRRGVLLAMVNCATSFGASSGWAVQIRAVDLEGEAYEFDAPVIGWATHGDEIEPVFVKDGAVWRLSEYRRLFDARRISCWVVREVNARAGGASC